VLQLNETGVDDAALQHLRGLNSLTRLELRQTPISDAALAVLGALHGLRVLDVRQTGITDAGSQRLAKALPSCRIAH